MLTPRDLGFIRCNAGLTLKQVATASGVSTSTVSRWEKRDALSRVRTKQKWLGALIRLLSKKGPEISAQLNLLLAEDSRGNFGRLTYLQVEPSEFPEPISKKMGAG